MNKLTFSIIALLLSACAPEMKKEGLKVDSVLQAYASRFEQVSLQQNRPVTLQDITITFEETLAGNTIGLCRKGGGEQPKVIINKSFWDVATNSSREQLMFHELAHCVLGRDHDNTTIMVMGYQVKASIMSSYHLYPYMFEPNYNYYMSELFGNTPSTNLLTMTGPSQFNPNFYASMASEFKVREFKTTLNDLHDHADGTMEFGCGEQ